MECVLLQFYTDANEAESWLNEKMALVASADYGEDGPSAQALLQRHRDLQGELNAYSGDIASLNSQAEKLVQAGISTLEVKRTKLCHDMEHCVVFCCWWDGLHVLVLHFVYAPCVEFSSVVGNLVLFLSAHSLSSTSTVHSRMKL